jgi:outer membrane receptor protein involved in Fe transport
MLLTREPGLRLTLIGGCPGWVLCLVALLALAGMPQPASADEAGDEVGTVDFADESGAERAEESGADESEEGAGEPAAAVIGPPPGVEVIRIKGRAIAAIETDVPASVTQFDASEIEALGAQSIADLAKVTPNVEIKTVGATAPTFFIRGVGLSDFNANATSAVAIFQDDVALNAQAIQLSQLFDIENVEVLRGPQGSQSGRNASAGAIKVYSRRPTWDFESSLNASYGNFGYKDFEGAVGIPLVEETLASRLAFRWAERDGWMKNRCGGAPPLEERLGDPTGSDPNPEFEGQRFCSEGLRRFIPNPDPPPNNFFFDGFYSLVPGELPGKVNDIGRWAARGQLRFQPPGTDMEWLLNLHGGRLDQLAEQGQIIETQLRFGKLGKPDGSNYRDPDIAEMEQELKDAGITDQEERDRVLGEILARDLDKRPYEGDFNFVGSERVDTLGTSLRGSWSIGALDFASITGFEYYERTWDSNDDSNPNVLFESYFADDGWQVSQELRLGSELADTPLRWEIGGYYLNEKISVDSLFNFGAIQFVTQVYEQGTSSFFVYGHLVWDFLDDFTLEGGIRYNWEDKTFDLLVQRIRSTGALPTVPSDDAQIWSAPTGTVILTYRFNEDVSAYGKYTRGWKSGHFNASATEIEKGGKTTNVTSAEPETIDAFEVGLRGRWLDGRLALGGALFYYSYDNYQVFVIENSVGSPPRLEVINANDAEVYGAELDFRLEPLAGWAPHVVDGLVLTGRFGWLESQYLDFTDTLFRSISGGGPLGGRELVPLTYDYTGNQLTNAPRFKASGAVEWPFDLGRWGTLMPRYDFAFTDDIFFDPTEGIGVDGLYPEYAIAQPAYWLHNARLTYRLPGGNIEIAGWVRNFTGTVYETFAFDASAAFNAIISLVGEPRTYGGTISISW